MFSCSNRSSAAGRRRVHVQDDRVFVRRIDRLEPGREVVPLAVGDLAIADALHVPLDVVGGELASGVPRHGLAQVQFELLGVAGVLPAFGQHRFGLQLVVEIDQPLVDRAVGGAEGVRLKEHTVERDQVVAARDLELAAALWLLAGRRAGGARLAGLRRARLAGGGCRGRGRGEVGTRRKSAAPAPRPSTRTNSRRVTPRVLCSIPESSPDSALGEATTTRRWTPRYPDVYLCPEWKSTRRYVANKLESLMARPAPNRRRHAASLRALDDGAPFAERVYSQLRQAILDGQIKAGERMREFDLAEQFGMSRTPVREALKRLAVEGLVVDLPSRGLVVSEPSPNEILDAYLVREMLEGLAARLAAERATETDRIHLTAVLRQVQNAIAAGADQQAITLSNEFDRLLFAATRDRRLSHMIEFARASQGRLLRLSLQYPGRLAQSAEERAEILQAIQLRDPEAGRAGHASAPAPRPRDAHRPEPRRRLVARRRRS